MKKRNLFLFHRVLLVLGLYLLGQISIFANASYLQMDVSKEKPSLRGLVMANSLYNDSTNVDSIAKTVLKQNSIPVQFENDPVNPWYSTGKFVRSGNNRVNNSTSTFKFSYTSNNQTEVCFRTYNSDNSKNSFKYYLDGVYLGNNSGYRTSRYERFYIPKGKHVFEFRDSVIKVSGSSSIYSVIDDVCIREILPLEQAVLSPYSKPLMFTNDEAFPWTIEDGYIQNSNYGHKNTSARFSTTFTIDKPHKFAFDAEALVLKGNAGSDLHNLKFYINDVLYQTLYNDDNFYTVKAFLEPGTYKMEWVDSLSVDQWDYRSRIKNIELSDNWIDVDVKTPGTLGIEVLKKVNVLKDVELLRVKGEFNDVDWQKLSQMNGIIGLDLTQTKITSVPDNGFSKLFSLRSVKLPEGLKTIGYSSFKNTNILSIDIPSTVISIGESAFENVETLLKINFKKNSQLKYIGHKAFSSCKKLEGFVMPNSVVELISDNNDRGSVFENCESLKYLIFSDSLKNLPDYTCNRCLYLENVHLPKNLISIGDYCFYNNYKLKNVKFPNSLYSIGNYAFNSCAIDTLVLHDKLRYIYEYAFRQCKDMKYLELPSSVSDYKFHVFEYCNSINTIVINAIVPPVVDELFYGVSISNITLKVPRLGLETYKLDPYWYKFGNIQPLKEWIGDIFITDQLYELYLPDEIPANWKTNVTMSNSKSRFNLYGQSVLSANIYEMYEDFYSDDIHYNDRKSNRHNYNYCASFINNANMRADDVVINLRLKEQCWNFMSLPFVLSSLEVEPNISFAVRTYSGEARANGSMNETWQDVKNWDDILPNTGFIFHSDNPNSFNTFIKFLSKNDKYKNDIFINSNIQVYLKEYVSEFAHNRSWNFIGNPYPCFYDTRAMDFTAPITVWDTYNQNYRAYSPIDDCYILRPFEAFFVQKPVDVDKITFSKAGRQHDRAVRNEVTYRKAILLANDSDIKRNVFNITLKDNNGHEDRTRFVINGVAKRDYEINCDATKFKSENNEIAQLFTIENGVNFSINERPMHDGIIQLGVQIGKSGSYEIGRLENCDTDVILYDNLLGKKVNLSLSSYMFDAEQGEDIERFEIRLGNDFTGVEEITADEDEYIIYDLQGRKLNNTSSKGVFIINGKKIMK